MEREVKAVVYGKGFTADSIESAVEEIERVVYEVSGRKPPFYFKSVDYPMPNGEDGDYFDYLDGLDTQDDTSIAWIGDIYGDLVQ